MEYLWRALDGLKILLTLYIPVNVFGSLSGKWVGN